MHIKLPCSLCFYIVSVSEIYRL